MAIAVPLLGTIERVPQIDASRIPPDQDEAMKHIAHLLSGLTRFERQFRYAVLLFDASHQEEQALIQLGMSRRLDWGVMENGMWTLSAWSHMAARDGALAIYHFGNTIQGIWASLPACPSIASAINEAALREASKEFRDAFRRYEAIRHVVGHVSDFFFNTQQKRSEHAAKGKWQAGGAGAFIGSTDEQGASELPGNLAGDTYVVSFRGEATSYALNAATVDIISSVRSKIYASFLNVAIANP